MLVSATGTSPPSAGSGDRYVPAAGREVLTPIYDVVTRTTMRESLFRPRLVAQTLAGLEPGGRVLELGCGTGALTALLADGMRKGGALTGLDGDTRALDRARARLADPPAGSPVADLLLGTATELPFADGVYDRVVASLLLHHLSDEAKAATLAEALRVLAPGGSLHIADWGRPAGLVPRAGFGLLRLIDGRENTRLHAQGGLPGLIAAAGFEGVERRGRMATVWGSLEFISAAAPR